MTQFEESQRGLERDFRLRRADRQHGNLSGPSGTSRFAVLTARLHRSLQPEPCPSLAELLLAPDQLEAATDLRDVNPSTRSVDRDSLG